MRNGTSALLCLFFLASACAPPPGPATPAVDLKAERAALMAADDALAEACATTDDRMAVLSAAFLDDANVLAPNTPLAEGKESSMAIFATMIALPGFSLHWKADIAEVGSGGDLGYTIGNYHMEFEDPDGNPVVEDGKFMTVWRKVDGEWKVAVDMFNSNGPPPSTD